MKKVQWYTSTATIISTMAFAVIWLGLVGWVNIPNPPQITHTGQSEAYYDASICGLDTVECDDYITMKTTAFSSIECKSEWCNNNPERIGHQVALNYSKFGQADKIYIPEYDKTYDVVGTTDQKTDLDIYFGTDQNEAKNYGVKYLDIKLIK